MENSGWAHVQSDLVDWQYYEPDLGVWARSVADLASGVRESFPVKLAADFVVDKSLYGDDAFPRTGVPIVNSEYGEGFTSLERAWHLRWETQELRRQDRFAGYVYTEFADVEHEAAGLLSADRRAKDWGGCRPADVNAETVLVIDLVPLAAGADLAPPASGTSLHVRVSHHGAQPVTGRVLAARLPYGSPLPAAPPGAAAMTDAVTATPFTLSEPVGMAVEPRSTPGRLGLWFVDADGTTRARAFLDAAEVEPVNRRGARPGEFANWRQPGLPD